MMSSNDDPRPASPPEEDRSGEVPRADLGARVDYRWDGLSMGDLGADPIPTVRRWLAEAEGHLGDDFNSMVLSTVDAQHRPSSRNVLLRELDADGRFWFFTNRSSHKGRDIAHNPEVSLLFTWLGLFRQIRVDGVARHLDDAPSDEYFAGRPRDSQIAAWASEQSTVIGSRAELLESVSRYNDRFAGRDVPRPPNWGGYAVSPRCIEFWQGQPSRLHDRIRFTRDAASGRDTSTVSWVRERLAP